MSRPQQYDRAIALDAAIQVFWAKGFHATSVKDLEVALSMKSGSIYCAFTSKEALYLLALERYFDAALLRFWAQIDRHASPLDGLAEHLRSMARPLLNDSARQTCMLTRTLAETSVTHPEIAAQTKTYLTTMRAAFAAAFGRAQILGELPAEADCAALARRFQAAITALRFELQLGTEPSEITSMAQDFAKDIESLRLARPH
jgi:TetR/AcrR family transcriptional regulator, transcriptional repressor for nem operon